MGLSVLTPQRDYSSQILLTGNNDSRKIKYIYIHIFFGGGEMEQRRPFALCYPLPADRGDKNRDVQAGDIYSNSILRFVSGSLTEHRIYDTNNHV